MAKKSLEERIERLEDIHEIQNLMSKYEYFHTAGWHDETAELFATKTPGVKADIVDWGLYEGTEGIKRLYSKVHKYVEGNRIGCMSVLPISTPVIEVAGDGETAKGLWIMTGSVTFPVKGKLQGNWAWGKYGIDFVKEDGKWKFWHVHVYAIFFTPYERSWVEASEIPNRPIPDELKPDKPPSYLWTYTPTAKTELVPVPPEPYETWDDSMSY